jgi:2-succinyl-5-enolpyruvyl-6-hydroxy-3-cyclohexene-1-carboxylate synthase
MSVLRQNLDHLVALLHSAGIRRWAVSPGSRNAPIVAGFIRHGGFELHSFPDERSAGFAALGMSIGEKYPAGVICTSGSATLNLYPAICEAYYQRIPLFVVTADRPEELIDQWDGQTIHQKELYEKHILASFETPDMDDEYSTLLLEQLVYEAAETALTPVQGPVHLNVPLRDPIYAGLENEAVPAEIEHAFAPHWTEFAPIDVPVLTADLNAFKKILILCGQSLPNIHISQALEEVKKSYPIIADITSNQFQHGLPNWDAALLAKDIPDSLHPDLIISIGLSFVSKPLKLFLQKIPDLVHWHISPAGFVGDPFLTDPEIKRTDPALFLAAVAAHEHAENIPYLEAWKGFCSGAEGGLSTFPRLKINHKKELEIVRQILHHANKKTAVHFGNSMPIRYAGWIGNTNAEVYCNRGTSGIDGCISTAIGYAMARPDQQVVCVVGDVAFFYDSNAFWTNAIPSNLKVILLNNFGGKIFDFISGPDKEPRIKKWIETPHKLEASHVASLYGLDYQCFENSIADDVLNGFLHAKACGILEIQVG